MLSPLTFILHSTLLSTVVSKSPLHHHLHADDTQLFISVSSEFLSDI
jgi:hypothetical protein